MENKTVREGFGATAKDVAAGMSLRREVAAPQMPADLFPRVNNIFPITKQGRLIKGQKFGSPEARPARGHRSWTRS